MSDNTYKSCFEYKGNRYCLTYYKPRPYQEQAVDAWINNGEYGAVQLPTGAGKTYVAFYAWERLGFPKMVLVVPTKALKNSHIHALEKLGVPSDIITEDPRKKEGKVAVITYALITRYPWLFEQLKREGYTFWVFDESHHTAAKKFFENVFETRIHAEGEDRGVAVLGISATPHSSGYYVDELKEFLPIVYKKTYDDLKEYLAPINLYLVATPLSPEKQEEYEDIERRLQKLRRELMARYNTLNMAVLSRYMEHDNAVRAYFQLFNKKKAILNFVPNKDKAIAAILRAYPNERAMIFSERQDQLLKVMKDLKDKYGIKGYPFVNKTVKNKKQEKKVLDAFREGKFRVLGIVKKGEEGVDFPDVSIGIIVSTPKNQRTIIQRVGRIIRKKPGKVAKIFYLYAPGTEEEKVAKKFIELLNPSHVYWITMGEIGSTPDEIPEPKEPKVDIKVVHRPDEVLLSKITLKINKYRKHLRDLEKEKAELESKDINRRDIIAWTAYSAELNTINKKIIVVKKSIDILEALRDYKLNKLSKEQLLKRWRTLHVDEKEVKAAVGSDLSDALKDVPMPIRILTHKQGQAGIDNWVR